MISASTYHRGFLLTLVALAHSTFCPSHFTHLQCSATTCHRPVIIVNIAVVSMAISQFKRLHFFLIAYLYTTLCGGQFIYPPPQGGDASAFIMEIRSLLPIKWNVPYKNIAVFLITEAKTTDGALNRLRIIGAVTPTQRLLAYFVLTCVQIRRKTLREACSD